MRRRMLRKQVALVALVFVMAACGGSPADNPANAEAMVEAVYGSDDDALSDLPWGNGEVERGAEDAREFALTVDAELLESSCVNTDANPIEVLRTIRSQHAHQAHLESRGAQC
jgi:hypothetical protein